MRETLLVSALFLATVAFSATVIPSLPAPFCYAPLLLATGLFVMNRMSAIVGALWMVFGAFMLGVHIAPMLAGAVVGAALAARVLAARSVYALLGLGAAVAGVVSAVDLVLAAVEALTNEGVSMWPALGRAAWQAVLLLALLYAGFLGLHAARHTLHRFFVLRSA